MEESYFDGGLLQLVGWTLLGILVTVCTLGMGGLHDMPMGDQTHSDKRSSAQI